MLNEKIKEKAKNGAEKVKDFWDDYGLVIGYCAVCVAITAGTVALERRRSKKALIAWREAQKQMLDGNRNYDYGPYKLCKFFDPNTLEEIGKIVMHKDTVEAFLKVRNCKTRSGLVLNTGSFLFKKYI